MTRRLVWSIGLATFGAAYLFLGSLIPPARDCVLFQWLAIGASCVVAGVVVLALALWFTR